VKVVAIINHKGGVGKTTLTANLGAGLAARGQRVLLIDLDAQASLTVSFFTQNEWTDELLPTRTIKHWYDGLTTGDAMEDPTALLSSPQLTTQFEWIAHLAPGGLHVPFLIIVPIAMALAATFGVLLGAPTLRLRGDYLAIVTLGFGEIVRIFMNNLDRPVNITNGPKGITGIDPVTVAGFNLSQTHELFGMKFPSVYMYYYLFVLCALFVIWVCTRLQHSRIGRAWAAIREDEIAAKAMGINTRNVKLLAFAMGASFGGLSGAMFGAFQGFVSPESFTFWESIVVLACVVLGGMGHIPGVILGAVLLAVFPEFLRSTMGPLQHAIFGHQIVDTEVIRQLLYGLAMVLIMLYRSEGLWPAAKHEDKIAKIAKRAGKKPVRA